MSKAEELAQKHDGPVLIGGPGTGKPTTCPGFNPLELHNPDAVFTTRGCPNNCGFCMVKRLEPDYYEIPNFIPKSCVCDNNFTAASKKHQERAVDKLKTLPFVDFNQGMEAKLFTPGLADLLGNLKCKIRFAFDHVNYEKYVKEAIDLCKKKTSKNIGVYVLIGYNDTPEDALYRLEKVRSWGIRPNPMRFQPLDAIKKNAYVSPNWDEAELRKMMRYYSILHWVEHIPYAEYDRKEFEKSKKVVNQ
jgi:hypothetical protein